MIVPSNLINMIHLAFYYQSTCINLLTYHVFTNHHVLTEAIIHFNRFFYRDFLIALKSKFQSINMYANYHRRYL